MSDEGFAFVVGIISFAVGLQYGLMWIIASGVILIVLAIAGSGGE